MRKNFSENNIYQEKRRDKFQILFVLSKFDLKLASEIIKLLQIFWNENVVNLPTTCRPRI